jgi:hypothetical protein
MEKNYVVYEVIMIGSNHDSREVEIVAKSMVDMAINTSPSTSKEEAKSLI